LRGLAQLRLLLSVRLCSKRHPKHLRRTSERFYRAAHEFNFADARVDDVAKDGLGALVGHAPIAVGNGADVHTVDDRVRFGRGECGKWPVQ
jgi:hypothetical protein